MKITQEFIATESLSLENSFATIKEQENIELQVTIGIDSNERGWFEIYDIESGGEEWYAEGELEIDGMAVVGYDGVFALPRCIVDKLEEMGYDVSEIE
jgi:hypothetical protein